MEKSAAEKMKEYRKRLKDDPEKYKEYLEKAKQRKMKNYIPVSRLSRKEKVIRREKTKEYVKHHRAVKKVAAEAAVAEADDVQISETSGYETNSAETSGHLIVNMPFPNRRNGHRKRNRRALARKHREFNELKHKFDNLQKKYKRDLRSLQRFRKKAADKSRNVTLGACSYGYSSANSPSVSGSIESEAETPALQSPVRFESAVEPCTPRSKTKQMLAKAGLNKKQSAKVRKQLLLANVFQVQVEKCRRGMKRTEMGALRGFIGGKILSKYRLAKEVSQTTGLGRNRMTLASRLGGVNIFTRRREIKLNEARVLEFLMRDDNSRCDPGKQDKIKVKGETHQTRVLTDYLTNLHQKFLSENPDSKLSLASFCRIRPAYLKLTRFTSRSSCLCTKHQNFALCTKALRNCGVTVPLNPETFVKDEDNINKMKTDMPDEITFGQWKRVKVEYKGRTKMIMKVVTNTMIKADFLKHMGIQISEFKDHAFEVRRQHGECLNIKKNLPKDEVIVNMDFAENYSCKSEEAVMSEYWNKSGVTLHPVVLYYKDSDEELKHKSIVMVSDEMGHCSSTVLAFIDNIVPEIKRRVPDVRKIHYFTDSPTSQYRNKTIFSTVANHEDIYQCEATWNYFEAGHGKGPCDGLGGTTKRMADEAVRSGNVEIQDGEEFYKWTQSPYCTMKNVHFMFVPSSECQKKASALDLQVVKPIKGTMRVHAIIGKGNGTILTSDVSCFCNECHNGNHNDCKSNNWKQETMIISARTHEPSEDREAVSSVGPETQHELNTEAASPSGSSEAVGRYISKGDYVAARYDGKIYTGKVLECDEEDGEIEITFMQNVRRLLQWPKHEDRIWVSKEDIVCRVAQPIPTGKSERMFKLSESDLEMIERKK